MYFTGCHHYTVYTQCILQLKITAILGSIASFYFLLNKQTRQIMLYTDFEFNVTEWGDIVCTTVVDEQFIYMILTYLIPHLISCGSVWATNPQSCNKDNEHQSASRVCHSSVSR